MEFSEVAFFVTELDVVIHMEFLCFVFNNFKCQEWKQIPYFLIKEKIKEAHGLFCFSEDLL